MRVNVTCIHTRIVLNSVETACMIPVGVLPLSRPGQCPGDSDSVQPHRLNAFKEVQLALVAGRWQWQWRMTNPLQSGQSSRSV